MERPETYTVRAENAEQVRIRKEATRIIEIIRESAYKGKTSMIVQTEKSDFKLAVLQIIKDAYSKFETTEQIEGKYITFKIYW